MKPIKKNFYIRLATALCLVGIFFVSYVYYPLVLSYIFVGCLAWILFVEWAAIGAYWLTLLYPVLPFVALIMLNQTPTQRFLIPLILYTAYSFDTGGYIAGTLWGTTKLCPAISPKKTWAGLWGGLFLTCSTAPIVWYISGTRPCFVLLMVLNFFLCFLALFGDLLVSYFKRKAKVKDSGSILPGHGGLLDRFDSILLIVIVVFAAKNWLTP